MLDLYDNLMGHTVQCKFMSEIWCIAQLMCLVRLLRPRHVYVFFQEGMGRIAAQTHSDN